MQAVRRRARAPPKRLMPEPAAATSPAAINQFPPSVSTAATPTVQPSARARRGRDRARRGRLRRARSRNQQLPPAAGAPVAARLPRGRCLLAHHPPRRRRSADRTPVRAAMARTLDALKVCAGKLAAPRCARAPRRHRSLPHRRERAGVPRSRRDELGLDIEMLTRETEARPRRLRVGGADRRRCDYVLVFDIGGGSSELIWLDLTTPRAGSVIAASPDRLDAPALHRGLDVAAGRRRHAGRALRRPARHAADFEAMVAETRRMLHASSRAHKFRATRRPPTSTARHVRHRDHRRRHPARADAL